ncbi:hypothetical protein [Aggregatibacter actinomycetemcomitans]|uniref:hypothetical protein n=1 Tax=Aggregatibacter actinomycetemcomitans TaxID=714 RepID=UPI00023FEEC6|nr:hypothetical protein [Aggregatibacter actinomycetemcomitans]EHK90961.1 gp6 [Aggregatibacter actinomycetemcomitans RhAA1]
MLNPEISLHIANLSADNDIVFLSDGGYSYDPQLGELNQKAQYLQNALDVDYGTALDIISQ